MDYNKERLYNISTEKEFREFMKKADEADTWDAMEPDEWESACEYAGIKYSDYDNPDQMWEDLQYELRVLDADNEFDEIRKEVERTYSDDEWEQFNLEMDSHRRYLALRYNVDTYDIN